MFTLCNEDGYARTGSLFTAHDVVETPFFMPVATKGAAKHLSPIELKSAGSKALICNSFLLSLSPGVEIIESSGGLHRFMGWQGVIFTDSGGFQMGDTIFSHKTTAEGAYFKSPYDGKFCLVTPETSVKTQESLGSDVMMCLDEMPSYGESAERVSIATRMTHSYARKCLAAKSNSKQLLFGICQGGTFPKLREKSAAFISKLDFDGISIGGLAVGEPREDMLSMLDVCKGILPKDKPHYLMGVGSPSDMLEAIERGIDMFDSAFPTQNARHGTLFTSNGKIKITNTRFKLDSSPVDDDCDCYFCKTFSRSYLYHLFRNNEALGLRLASLHNITFVNHLLELTKTSIKEGNFISFKKTFLQNYSI